MKKADIYNNGRGWRISFSFQGAVRVLTSKEAQELLDMLQYALKRIDSITEKGEEYER